LKLAIFICPTYFLLGAFPTSYKGEFAISPGDHDEDFQYYYTSLGPAFNNAQFIASFSGAFMDLSISGDVNKKINSSNITPQWPKWQGRMHEMLFNVSSNGSTPVIHTVKTDQALLKRCE
jgi:acetylcholinesterase